tara:strand:+ start:1544 stop:1780 length:237 start_codon:yes stop_codon:yes gene_type:complete
LARGDGIDIVDKLVYAGQVPKYLDLLTERERRVIALRFGLGDGRSRTLEEVGKEFGVTRERIRQVEARAIWKMKEVTV